MMSYSNNDDRNGKKSIDRSWYPYRSREDFANENLPKGERVSVRRTMELRKRFEEENAKEEAKLAKKQRRVDKKRLKEERKKARERNELLEAQRIEKERQLKKERELEEERKAIALFQEELSREKNRKWEPAEQSSIELLTPEKSIVPEQIQFDNLSNGRICDVVIGLDFGTSCTKVVIRCPYEQSDDGLAYVVPFVKSESATEKYLIPSSVWVSQSGDLSLEKQQQEKWYRDIKLSLLDPGVAKQYPDDIDPWAIASGYLACVLRQVRHWFLNSCREVLGDLELRWHLNMGLPSWSYEDEEFVTMYRQLARHAWATSLKSGKINVNRITFSEGGSTKWDRLHEYQVYPEVIAEAVGYSHSPRREEGLHFIVDVGASTVDVCSFLIRDDQKRGNDCYTMLTADVQPLGTVALLRRLIESLREISPNAPAALWEHLDPALSLRETIASFPCGQFARRARRKARKEHCSKFGGMVGLTGVEVKTRRDPNSPKWSTGIPLFFCGGGSRERMFKRWLKETVGIFADNYSGAGNIRIRSLPYPNGCRTDIPECSWDRFAVAWGLSYTKFDIGDVERPSETSNVAPRREIVKKVEPWER